MKDGVNILTKRMDQSNAKQKELKDSVATLDASFSEFKEKIDAVSLNRPQASEDSIALVVVKLTDSMKQSDTKSNEGVVSKFHIPVYDYMRVIGVSEVTLDMKNAERSFMKATFNKNEYRIVLEIVTPQALVDLPTATFRLKTAQ